MRSSIITIDANNVPEDPQGWILATRIDLPIPGGLNPAFPMDRHVIHLEPGYDPTTFPNVLEVIINGLNGPWQAGEAAALWPDEAQYVLEAEWTDSIKNEIIRTKVVEVPKGITPTATNIIGHAWLGDI